MLEPPTYALLCLDVVTSRSLQGYDATGAMPPSAGIRGQYINTGSKDIGPDMSSHNPYIKYRKEQDRLKQQEQ